MKRVVNNIRERNKKVLGNEDWELFQQTIRILEICGKESIVDLKTKDLSIVFVFTYKINR